MCHDGLRQTLTLFNDRRVEPLQRKRVRSRPSARARAEAGQAPWRSLRSPRSVCRGRITPAALPGRSLGSRLRLTRPAPGNQGDDEGLSLCVEARNHGPGRG